MNFQRAQSGSFPDWILHSLIRFLGVEKDQWRWKPELKHGADIILSLVFAKHTIPSYHAYLCLISVVRFLWKAWTMKCITPMHHVASSDPTVTYICSSTRRGSTGQQGSLSLFGNEMIHKVWDILLNYSFNNQALKSLWDLKYKAMVFQ